MLSIPTGDPDSLHTRGHKVLKTMERNNLKHLSMGEPTYWPSDRNKVPDLVDFCVTKGIPQDFAVAKSGFDLSSNHSLVFITLTVYVLSHKKQPSLSNRHTNRAYFKCLIERLTLNVSLTEEHTEAAVNIFSNTIQWAGWSTLPEHTDTFKTYNCPIFIN
jgi:hypothetical protein